MKYIGKRITAVVLTTAMVVSMSGCNGKTKDKKEKKPVASASAEPESPDPTTAGNTKASGKGNNKSDVPLEVAFTSFDKAFNPFATLSENNEKAVELTQLTLLTEDREGAVITKGIEGQTRYYNGEEYTYSAPANLHINYQEKKNQTVYTIRLREDIVFGDDRPMTVDDVIFSIYAFCDTSYQGGETLGEQNIMGLREYRRGKANKISGIIRVNDYKLRIITKGYHQSTMDALDIPICPLHFYGNAKKYNYEKSQFGFEKGNISSLTKKKNEPMGAGAYNFIKFESGIIYYEANEKYYLGCPLTAFIQFKEIGNTNVEETIENLTQGNIDIGSLESSSEAVNEILANNSNGKLNGGTISTRFIDGSHYTYVGINAEKVCVDGRPDSTRSKNLRKALATLIGSGRYDLISNYRKADQVINYPNADTSWAVPQSGDEEYKGAYSTDNNGNVIYTSDMTLEERQEAAATAALGFLKSAGYRVKKGKVVSAPDNASKIFTVLLPRDATNYQEMSLFFTNARIVFRSIGLKLKVITNKNQEDINKMLRKGKQQMWSTSASTQVRGEFYSMYHSGQKGDKTAGEKNYFGIADSDLDEYIEEILVTAKMKKSIRLYTQCFDILMDWAVELPMYQERDVSIFSSSRINMETIPQDMTPYYGWMDEIHNVGMK